MSFDRLIGWVDDWADAHDRSDVIAQIGPSDYRPRRIRIQPFMDPPVFRKTMAEARCIVAHAGMGTILNALELGKPILVVPRLGALAETRNDHQVATAERFSEEGLILTASTPEEFAARMVELEALPAERARISDRGSPALLDRIRQFTTGEALPVRQVDPSAKVAQ